MAEMQAMMQGVTQAAIKATGAGVKGIKEMTDTAEGNAG